jgi:hypothetical protein
MLRRRSWRRLPWWCASQQALVALKQVRLDEERRDGLRGVHNDTRVVSRGFPLARVTIAHLVPDGRQAVDDLHKPAHDLLEVVVEVGAVFVDAELLRDGLEQPL